MEETEKTAELIAHELNNILMTISISLEMLGERIAHDETTDRLFAAARHGIAHGAKLNQQLLAFSRRQPIQRPVVQPIAQAAEINVHSTADAAQPQ